MFNPWEPDPSSSGPEEFVTRRVDAEHPFDFFWAKDDAGRQLFLVRLNDRTTKTGKPVKLKGLEMTVKNVPGEDHRHLILVLLRPELLDNFIKLCFDLHEVARRKNSEQSVVNAIRQRLGTWKKLLGNIPSGLLSDERRRGLIGELLFIRDYLLDRFQANECVAFWRGPYGADQDFSVGSSLIEVKTTLATAGGKVRISSGRQLDGGDSDLFLNVFSLSATSKGDPEGFSLYSLVGDLADRLSSSDPDAADQFFSALAEAGYHHSTDYDHEKFSKTGNRCFVVHGDFPRVTNSELRPGVANIRYSIELDRCNSFRINKKDFRATLEA
uniref:PD-(D/E)XK motif protein n=1 Tax=uncultured marine microorganism HF4000_APKG8K5 TaxID=455555 RepID=B3TB57_9ZZZZ|nr:hypothetical protein ALOHA_HF4000APKG8K5ctg1g35 [uncultured marine microorganism HF4000_APKG8K5]